jgi:sigma-B regulation protein RsbU (phosphoserine phosphatase)
MSRRFSMVAVVTAIFVMVVMALVISRDFAWLNSMDSDPTRIYQAERSVMIEVVFITAVLLVMMINLIVSYSKNLQLLFRNETGVLEKVRQGDLSNLVPIVTQDEFGLIAGHTNYMIQGLRHRLELIASIKLAEEIQRNLLPINPPDIKGVDLAGASIYCNETGGDYYDFFSLPKARLGVVVADAADHGLGSAMHMTSARAFLRAVMDSYTTPSQTISTLNSYLTRDSRNTGRFMTLFFLEIDPAKRQLSWVRAGHEPALLYDPIKKEMKVLDGSGVALGISEKVVYQTGRYENLAQGAVLVIGTDGIWETRNAAGEMFGKERLIRTIKSSAKKKDSAQKLLDRILTRINNWRGEQVQEDDTTLVTVILS